MSIPVPEQKESVSSTMKVLSIRNLHILFFCTVLALYFPVLGMGFCLDDSFIVVDNQYTTDWKNLWMLLSTDLWEMDPSSTEQTSFYRPLFSCSLLLDRSIADLNPMWYHAHSLIWFLLCVGGLLQLLKCFVTPSIALLATAVFAFHPIQVETIAWVSARNDSMATAFALGALLAFCHSKPKPWLGALLCAFALLSKENTLLLPLWVFFLTSATGKERYRFSAIAGIGIAVAFLCRAGADVPVQWPDKHHWDLFFSHGMDFFSDTLSLLFLPWPLAPTRALAWLDVSFLQYLSTIVFLCVMFGLSMWSLRRYPENNRMLFGGLILFWGAWLPSIIATVINGFYGDRYLFLASVGFSIWLSGILSSVGLLAKRIVFFSLIPLLGISYSKLPDWNDEQSIWTSMNRDIPSPFSQASLAHILHNQGRYAEAASLYEQSFSSEKPWLFGCESYVYDILQIYGPKAAFTKAEWVIERGCSRTGSLGSLMAHSLAVQQDWTRLRRLLPTLPIDPHRRTEIPWAALLIVDGQWRRVEQIRMSWPKESNMDQQLLELIRPIGIHELPALPTE